MQRNYFLLIGGLVFIMACTNNPATEKPNRENAQHKDKDSIAICELMKAQEAAWNFGDLKGFMKSYWESDSLKFIGKSGMQMGWNNTLTNYQKSYPDQAAMGRLKFTNLHVETLDAQNAYVIGQWQLFRTADTLSGHYSLLWKKINSKWVIVADHSS